MKTLCLCIKSLGRTHASGTKRYAIELYTRLKKNKKFNLILISAPQNSVWDKIPFFFLIYCFHKLMKLLISKKIDVFHSLSYSYSFFIPLVKLFGVKTVMTIQDVPKTFNIKYMENGILNFISLKLYRIFIRFSDYFFVISTSNKERLINEIGINKDRIFVTHLGVDDRFKPLIGFKDSISRIGYLGGKISLMNIRYTINLIKTFEIFQKMHENSELIISGRDKLNIIPNFIRQAKIKNLKYVGFILEKDIVKFYNSLDLFIFPSSYEGFGLPIMEAQRCGVPVIVWKDAHIPKEVTKYCIKVRTQSELIKKMNLIFINKELKEKLGRKCFEYSKKFTWKQCSDKTISGYEKIIKG